MTPMAIHRLHVVHLYKCLDRKAATGLCHLWLPENPALPWSCAIALASPCLNAPHPLVVSPNVWCAWWKASKMVQRSCLKPTWHLKSSKQSYRTSLFSSIRQTWTRQEFCAGLLPSCCHFSLATWLSRAQSLRPSLWGSHESFHGFLLPWPSHRLLSICQH